MLPTSSPPPRSQAPDHLDAAQEGRTQMAVETVNAISDALRYVSEAMSLKVTDSVYQPEQPAAESSSKEASTVDHLDAAQVGRTQMAVETVNAVSGTLRHVSEAMSLKVTDSVCQPEQLTTTESSKEASTVMDHLDAAQEGRTQMAVETVNAVSDALRYVSEAMSLKVTDSVYQPEQPVAESSSKEAPTMDHLDAAQEGRTQAVAETATYVSDAVGGFLKYFSGFKGPADVAEASNWKN